MSTLREQVRKSYAAAAEAARDGLAAESATACGCCGDDAAGAGCAPGGVFGPALYENADAGAVPEQALRASLGCGNPTAVADLVPGDVVLDLGSGGGIDALLAARRVGPGGKVYGLDMTDEMLALAEYNRARAGADNVEFLKGYIEQVPLPDASVDVVISNCVINLSTDKPAVFAEMARVLAFGGRIGITDVVADDRLGPAERAERGSHVGCIAGALRFEEYRRGLSAAGFADITFTPTHEVAEGMHSVIVKARRSKT